MVGKVFKLLLLHWIGLYWIIVNFIGLILQYSQILQGLMGEIPHPPLSQCIMSC